MQHKSVANIGVLAGGGRYLVESPFTKDQYKDLYIHNIQTLNKQKVR